MRRWILRVVAALVVAWLGLVVWGLVFAWRSVPGYVVRDGRALAEPIMSMAEYGELAESHARPYVVELDAAGGGSLVLFGAEHTRDPSDPQLAEIDRLWAGQSPTVALVESRLGILFPGFMDPVRTFSEPGHVARLAKRDGVTLYTWEPEREEVIAGLLDRFDRREVALLQILNPYFSTVRHGKPEDPEGFVEGYRAERVRWPGLEGTFESVEAIDAYWAEMLPEGPDWREVSDQWGLPGPLDAIAAAANDLRDEHFGRVVVELVGRGERVFAVAGSSHAVRLEGPVRATLARPTDERDD